MLDDFEVDEVRYLGKRYRCPEHAQWAAFFSHLKLDYDYRPLTFDVSFPGIERYKLKDAKLRIVSFDPTFFVHDVGFIHVTNQPAFGYTIQCAERLADEKDEPVYIIHGPPRCPTAKEVTNPVIVLYGSTPPRRGYRLMHDGKRFYIGKPRVISDVFAHQIMDAAIIAELCRPGVLNGVSSGRQGR